MARTGSLVEMIDAHTRMTRVSDMHKPLDKCWNQVLPSETFADWDVGLHER